MDAAGSATATRGSGTAGDGINRHQRRRNDTNSLGRAVMWSGMRVLLRHGAEQTPSGRRVEEV
jgi:hypothetical protein